MSIRAFVLTGIGPGSTIPLFLLKGLGIGEVVELPAPSFREIVLEGNARSITLEASARTVTVDSPDHDIEARHDGSD